MATHNRNDLLFLGRMNVRYHESMELFYGRFLNWAVFASLLLSSTAFAAASSMLPDPWRPYRDAIIAALALGMTLLNAAVVAFGMYGKFIVHVDLKKRWITFLWRLEQTDDAQLHAIDTLFNELNAQEPAPNRYLLNRAHAKTQEALGWAQPSV